MVKKINPIIEGIAKFYLVFMLLFVYFKQENFMSCGYECLILNSLIVLLLFYWALFPIILDVKQSK